MAGESNGWIVTKMRIPTFQAWLVRLEIASDFIRQCHATASKTWQIYLEILDDHIIYYFQTINKHGQLVAYNIFIHLACWRYCILDGMGSNWYHHFMCGLFNFAVTYTLYVNILTSAISPNHQSANELSVCLQYFLALKFPETKKGGTVQYIGHR